MFMQYVQVIVEIGLVIPGGPLGSINITLRVNHIVAENVEPK